MAVSPSSTAIPRIALAGQDYKTWKDYGGGADNSHYVELTQINKSNVSQLEVAWTYPTGDNRSYVFNPIVVDNVMYVMARNSSLVALDAATGKEIWIHENLQGLATRGIAYWESKDRKDRRLIFAINNRLQAIDARTGKSILTFGNKGLVDLREGLGRDPKTIVRVQPESPGRVFENLILLGSSTGEAYLSTPGDIRAYDVVTGKLVWSFHTIPHPGEEGYETWPKDAWKYAGGTNTWGEITVDEKRGIAYFPTGSPTYDYYGADRIGANLFGNCLLALDARTGKKLWHFQMVHHDLWDYDNNAAPQLITVRHEGKVIDAVSQATKQGFLFVFDRVTGKPLWPVEERPVPASLMPGEQAWPTQPYPTAPPPYARQKMTADDVNPFILTPEERAAWKERISKMRNEGLFTPPGFEETISLPGARGGSNWGTSAANPAKGLVYLTTQDWPTIYKLSLDDPLAARTRREQHRGLEQGRDIYRNRCESCHGPNGEGSGPTPALAGDQPSRARRIPPGCHHGPREDARVWRSRCRGNFSRSRVSRSQWRAGRQQHRSSTSDALRARSSRPVERPAGLEVPAIETRYTPLGGPPYPPGVGRAGESLLHRLGPLSEPAVHHRSAVVGARRVRPEQRNDQMESAAGRRREGGRRGREERRGVHGRAPRPDRDVDRTDLRRHDGRQGARARRRDRQGALDGESPLRIGRAARDVRSERPAVSRGAGLVAHQLARRSSPAWRDGGTRNRHSKLYRVRVATKIDEGKHRQDHRRLRDQEGQENSFQRRIPP